MISCHPTKKLCSRCWNGSTFRLWFWCSLHSICNILVNTSSMSDTAFCTGALSYNSLFENNCLSRIWPSVWSTLGRVVNKTLGLFPSGKTQKKYLQHVFHPILPGQSHRTWQNQNPMSVWARWACKTPSLVILISSLPRFLACVRTSASQNLNYRLLKNNERRQLRW